MNRTHIPYADFTWNPFVGCSHIGQGCVHCYAERLASTRLRHLPAYAEVTGDHGWTGNVHLMPERLDEPLALRKPAVIFVGDMGDLYHPEVPFDFIAAVHGVMAACQQHTFLTFSKRALQRTEFMRWANLRGEDGANLFGEDPLDWRIRQLCHVEARRRGVNLSADKHQNHGGPWPLPNVWQITSCSTQDEVDELLPIALATPAAHRGVSLEPLVEAVDLERVQWPGKHKVDVLRGGYWSDVYGLVNHSDFPATLDWVIAGGESGPKARPCDVEWLRSIVRQCRQAGVSYYTKQLGSNAIGEMQLTVDQFAMRPWPTTRAGSDPAEFPDDLRVREMPWRMGC